MARITTRDSRGVADKLANFESFKTGGALTGDAYRTGETPFGQLDPQYRDSVRTATYVIHSYQTPIAWKLPTGGPNGTWFMPQTKYTVTTTKHQTTVRHALSILGAEILTTL